MSPAEFLLSGKFTGGGLRQGQEQEQRVSVTVSRWRGSRQNAGNICLTNPG